MFYTILMNTHDIQPPAVMVVGKTVELSRELNLRMSISPLLTSSSL
ncbi:MAG: hypothetical protein NZ526_02880 [Aquificaceae bacterium]|nr:hypothetical protein [Aquificaceae bacterium]